MREVNGAEGTAGGGALVGGEAGAEAVVTGDVAAGQGAGGLAARADAELGGVFAGAEGAGFFVVVLQVVEGDDGEVPEEFHGSELGD